MVLRADRFFRNPKLRRLDSLKRSYTPEHLLGVHDRIRHREIARCAQDGGGDVGITDVDGDGSPSGGGSANHPTDDGHSDNERTSEGEYG